MHLYYVALGVLCVWRITHLLQAEDGPADLVVRLRRAAGEGFSGSLLDCFYCLSLWVSAPFAVLIGQAWMERGMLWLALSAAAILLERITTGQTEPAQAAWFEHAPDQSPQPNATNSTNDEENNHVLLRQTTEHYAEHGDNGDSNTIFH